MVDDHQTEAKTVTMSITGASPDLLSLSLEIRFTNNSKLVSQKLSGSLSPLPQQLLDAYADWKRGYSEWGKTYRYWQRTIALPTDPIETNVSIKNCDFLEKNLVQEFNNWLDVNNCLGLSKIAIDLVANVTPEKYKKRPELLSFIIQTKTGNSQLDLDLQKLPWNEWDFIRDKYNSGISLSTNTTPIVTQQNHQLKALVICGNYNNLDNQIDLQTDLDALQHHLRNVIELEIWISDPENTTRLELLRRLDRSTYNLLFFCGHSSSNNQIQLNDHESISVDDPRFKEILSKLKSRGLILAFFNSCSGLKIAHSLTSVGIPYVVVMKELIHDCVAQEFIKEFLEKAVQPETPIHIAVHKARQELQWIEKIPHGEFFPVLFQNPEQPPLYLNLQPTTTVNEPVPINRLSRWIKYLVIASISTIVIFIFANPLLQQWFWSWNSPPICEFANNTSLISCGEEVLFKPQGSRSSANKGRGFEFIRQGLRNPSFYQQAIKILEKDWMMNHDPETAIAIENAKIAQNSTAPIKNIAIVVPASTDTPPYIADSLLKGIAYAQQQHNRDSEASWKLRVVIADDSNTPKQALDIASILAKREDILGIVGHYSSHVTVPLVNREKTYEKKKVVLISPTATSHELTNTSRFFFRLPASSDVSTEDVVNKWVKPEQKIVLFYRLDREFSSSLADRFEKKVNNKYGNRITIKKVDLSRNVSIKDEMVQAKRAKFNSIVLFPDAYTGESKDNTIAEEIINYNDGEMPILANTSIYDLYYHKSQDTSAIIKSKLYKNIVMTIPWDYSNSTARYSEKLVPKDDPQKLPDVPKWWLADKLSIDSLNERIAMSYDTALVFIKALNIADDRLSVQRVISNQIQVQGITGSISFNGSDRREKISNLVTPNCDNTQCNGLKPYVGN